VGELLDRITIPRSATMHPHRAQGGSFGRVKSPADDARRPQETIQTGGPEGEHKFGVERDDLMEQQEEERQAALRDRSISASFN
jgi:hypothetical protein